MSHTTELQSGARDYLDAVAVHLGDLDVATRGELVADVADALAEQPADASFEQLVVKLGAPRAFADELRDAAGAAPRTVGVAADTAERDSAASRAVDALAASLEWSGRELEPIWWIVRGVAVVALIVVVQGVIFGETGAMQTTATLAILGILVSVALGARARLRTGSAGAAATTRQLRLRGAATVGLGLMFLVLVANSVGAVATQTIYPGDVSYEESLGLTLDGAQVNNVYAFDEQGRPLSKVRLFTETGTPINLFADAGDPTRENFADRTAPSVFNVFPVRYRDPATGTVTDPDAGFPESPGALRGATVAEPLTGASAQPAVAAEPVAPAKPAKPAVVAPAKPVVD